jgi:hypothetical protein
VETSEVLRNAFRFIFIPRVMSYRLIEAIST